MNGDIGLFVNKLKQQGFTMVGDLGNLADLMGN